MISLTNDLIKDVLPPNLFRTDCLSRTAKKLLATLIFNYQTTDKAKETGFFIASDRQLINALGYKTYGGYQHAKLLAAIIPLEKFDLIHREKGEKWKKGETKQASKYFINFDKIDSFYDCDMLKNDDKIL